jgi:hypothetical protein
MLVLATPAGSWLFGTCGLSSKVVNSQVAIGKKATLLPSQGHLYANLVILLVGPGQIPGKLMHAWVEIHGVVIPLEIRAVGVKVIQKNAFARETGPGEPYPPHDFHVACIVVPGSDTVITIAGQDNFLIDAAGSRGLGHPNQRQGDDHYRESNKSPHINLHSPKMLRLHVN